MKREVIAVGNQGASKPMMISVVAIAVILISFIGWYFFVRPTQSGGAAGQMGGPGMEGPGRPGMSGFGGGGGGGYAGGGGGRGGR